LHQVSRTAEHASEVVEKRSAGIFVVRNKVHKTKKKECLTAPLEKGSWKNVKKIYKI
jgi:hypothetical protein